MTKDERLKLAANFRKVADDFKKLCDKHNLHETKVDMDEPFDMREGTSLCKTPACHGGWGAIMYGLQGGDINSMDFYLQGADLIAQELGFDDHHFLTIWAENYPEYWGNDGGRLMFHSCVAFDQEHDCFPFPVIYKRYYSVADRLERG